MEAYPSNASGRHDGDVKALLEMSGLDVFGHERSHGYLLCDQHRGSTPAGARGEICLGHRHLWLTEWLAGGEGLADQNQPRRRLQTLNAPHPAIPWSFTLWAVGVCFSSDRTSLTDVAGGAVICSSAP
jgi:hypothetical protein